MKGIKKMLGVIGLSAGVLGPAMFGFAGCDVASADNSNKTFEEAVAEYTAFVDKLKTEKNFTMEYNNPREQSFCYVAEFAGDKAKITDGYDYQTYYDTNYFYYLKNDKQYHKVINKHYDFDTEFLETASNFDNTTWESYSAKDNALSGKSTVIAGWYIVNDEKNYEYVTQKITATLNENGAEIHEGIGPNTMDTIKISNVGTTVVNLPENYIDETKDNNNEASGTALINEAKQVSDAMAATYVMKDRNL